MAGAKAVVRLTLEVHCDDAWGDDCTLAQVRKQGRESALQTVGNLMSAKSDPGVRAAAVRRCKLVGPVEVEAVVT